KEGAQVQPGDLLISFDIEGIRTAGYNTVTPMIIANTDEYSAVTLAAEGKITAGSEFLKISKNQ
ncbi:MAG: PTS glucose transporter subunit IIA, partial [Oscillospiraceae bacterium]